MKTLNSQQLMLIEQQLGRKPRGIVSIAASSANGIPLVLQMRSLVDYKPFPTLFWLSSQTLCKAIGQIEGQGWVKSIEEKLACDEQLRAQYFQNQQAYVALRWQEMHEDDKQNIKKLGFNNIFNQYGIGGITQWDRVRCLHMQYAHHLAQGNVIGELLDQEFKLNELVIER